MDISRDSEEGLRWYTDGNFSALSVTEILGLVLEEDETGLDIWKERNDGEGDSPFWQHLYWYSGRRGTLCHYRALVHFEEHYEDGDMWGPEETRAIKDISRGPSQEDFEEMSERGDEVPTDLDEITYSVLKNKGVVSSYEQYEALLSNVTLNQVLANDIDFFNEQFARIMDELGVDDESVVAVEKYLLSEDPPFGGQTDLIYEDPNGDYVLADLKTSSGLRHKHRLQVVAYAHAAEAQLGIDIDRVEVWRISTDSKETKVHTDKVPEHLEDSPLVTADDWFVDPWGGFEYETIEDMWERFTELSYDAHDSV